MCGKAISVSLSLRFSNNHGTQTDKALLSFSSLKYIIPHSFFLAACPDETAQEDLLKTYVGPLESPMPRSSAIAINYSKAACKSSTMLAASTSGDRLQ